MGSLSHWNPILTDGLSDSKLFEELSMGLSSSIVLSPVGKLTLVASDHGLVAVLWQNDHPGRVRLHDMQEDPEHPIILRSTQQLNEYFSGKRTTFNLPLDIRGTQFQREVWSALLEIPFGETRTYLQLASKLGKPFAARAVGAANARNPISIVIPCHRVIGSSGNLTGFAGGLETKAHLLSLEKVLGRSAQRD